MTSYALRFLVVVVKIAPSVARSRESVKKSAEAPCRPRQATRCFTKLCARLLYKFKDIQRGVFCFFFLLINEELRRRLLTNIAMENVFFQILDTECVAGKRGNVPL